MKKFYISVRGGLGDTIRRYISGGDGWEYLSDLKEKLPDSRIKLIVMSSNPQATEFFKYHPLIDETVVGPWLNPNIKSDKAQEYAGDYIKLLGNPVLKTLKKELTGKVYLGPREEETISEIIGNKKFVLIHPFSSENRKMALPIEEYFPFVDKMIDTLGFNVMVVGADWIETRNGPAKKIREEFPYERPGLINLINKTNSRTTISLVQKAVGLITVRSFCFSSTISGKIKTILLVPPQGCKTYLGPSRTLGNLKQLKWPLGQISIIGVTKNYNTVRQKMIGALV
jgi:hypothetical protein